MTAIMGDDALLENALRHLRQAWADTADVWRDQARRDVDDLHLQPIEARARLAIRSIRQLEALLDEARRQCQ